MNYFVFKYLDVLVLVQQAVAVEVQLYEIEEVDREHDPHPEGDLLVLEADVMVFTIGHHRMDHPEGRFIAFNQLDSCQSRLGFGRARTVIRILYGMEY